jgi:23S rRNA pseudouridine2605 synthase
MLIEGNKTFNGHMGIISYTISPMSDDLIRLNRFIAMSGVASRRKADTLIQEGRVWVNDQMITRLGTKILTTDRVKLDQVDIHLPQEFVYYIINKPRGYVSTLSDPEGRPCVIDLVPTNPRVYPVGRLDIDSEGLLFLTNDGDFSFRMTHPKHEVVKVYEVLTKGKVKSTALASISRGIKLKEGVTKPAMIEVIDRKAPQGTWLRMTIHEGWNRQIRRMLSKVGLETQQLIRVAEGPIQLGSLNPGSYRMINQDETQILFGEGNHEGSDSHEEGT